MNIRTVDKYLGAAIIFLGAMQSASTFYFFRQFEEPAAWFFAGGMLLMIVGALSLLRLKYGELAAGVKYLSLAANVMLGLFWIALYWGLAYKFMRYPASYIGPVIVVAGAVVSLVNVWRSK